jgi:ABC-type nitrate/sulfonate/bicarbonate transport system substrate-binding protein
MPQKRDHISVVTSPTTRRTLFKAGGVVIGGVMLGGALAACGDDDEPSGSGSDAPSVETVDFQIRWLREVSFAGWYAGIEFGWFEEEGIDLEIVAGGPNLDVQQIVAGGGVPIGEGITDQILRGRIDQGIPFKIIGCLYQVNPTAFMSLAENGWTEPDDMVGRSIATTPAGRPVVNALLSSAGLSEDWEFIPSGFDATPLINGEADFFQGFRTGQGSALELEGYDINYITYPQFNYDAYDAPVFVLEDTLAEQEEMLVRFMRGSIKGWEWAAANPADAARMTVEKYGHDELTLEQQTAEGEAQVSDIVTDVTDENGLFYMEAERWTNMMEFLVSAGALESTVAPEEVMTVDVQQQAMDGNSELLSEEELNRAFD